MILMRMKTITMVMTVALVLTITGCSGQKSSQADTKETGQENTGAALQPDESNGIREEVIVVMGPSSEPEAGFDPAFGWGAGEHVHEPLIQSTLTVTTTDLKIGYDLATEVNASDNGRTWTVRLREGVRFTDGEELTAEDVAFTYNTLKDISSVNDFTMLERAEAVDRYTVIFHMNRPYSIWPYTMANVGIVPEHGYGENYGENPIGSGRYMLKQWDRGQQVILEANPDYYGESPKMKKVTILFMEEDAAYVAIRSGQADLAYTAAAYAEQAIPGYELLAFESVDNRGFNLPAVLSGETTKGGMAAGNDFTGDRAVRRAINLAIDRQAMIEHVLNGYGSPAYSVCDKMPWYNEAAQVQTNVSEAIRLLDEAGWKPGADGVREKNGVRGEFSLMYPAGDSVRQALAAETANQLREIGIEVKTEGVSWDTAYDRAHTEPLMWGWGAHTPMELYNIYHTEQGEKYARYSPYHNETVDQYMEEALASSNLEESYELWKKAQWDGKEGIIQEGDIPWIWLVNLDHLYWAREGLLVAEQKLHPHGHGWSVVNNIDQWTWKETTE